MTAPFVVFALMVSGACLSVEGDRILARDLARANEAFSALPGETPLGYGPAPGARRIFRPAELKRLATRHQIPLETSKAICFERRVEPLTRERLLAAMQASLGRPNARIEILECSRYPAPKGEVEFPRSGLTRPPVLEPQKPVLWHGRVRYAGNRNFRIWARVRISVPGERVVAGEDLRAGRRIERGQVGMENYEGFPFEDTVARSLDQVVGRVARRSINAGSPMWLRWLEQPKEVARGDIVRVVVRSGAARIEFDGRAEADGRFGETIQVRNLTSGKNFRARVDGRGQVLVNVGPERPHRQSLAAGSRGAR
jgi:flagella basal body P-ring formation protein FlgA